MCSESTGFKKIYINGLRLEVMGKEVNMVNIDSMSQLRLTESDSHDRGHTSKIKTHDHRGPALQGNREDG